MNRPSVSTFVRPVAAAVLVGAVALWILGMPTSIRAQETTPVTDLAYLSGIVSAAGSATLGPTLEAAAEAFAEQAPAVQVLVEATSSGKGLEKFCGGKTDLANAIPLCHQHHQWIHDSGFNHETLPDGSVRFSRRT